jgi:hypothetical protein
LGVIGLFQSLILGRKLEIATNFPNYLTKAILRPRHSFWEQFQSKDVEASQDKASLRQGDLRGGDAVGRFLRVRDIRFKCRFLCMVPEIWENKTRSVLRPFGKCKDVLINFQTEIKSLPHKRKGPET